MLCTGGNPDSNTLISDMATVICLDDYHCLDRKGRATAGVTALAPEAQNFDLMYEQVRHETRTQRDKERENCDCVGRGQSSVFTWPHTCTHMTSLVGLS